VCYAGMPGLLVWLAGGAPPRGSPPQCVPGPVSRCLFRVEHVEFVGGIGSIACTPLASKRHRTLHNERRGGPVNGTNNAMRRESGCAIRGGLTDWA
jgi:hypothetical protein